VRGLIEVHRVGAGGRGFDIEIHRASMSSRVVAVAFLF
jgi:hypothetical protein